MKDIIISVDSTSHKVNFPDEFLGIGYENLQGNLIFQFDNNFIGGQARLDISIDCESGMIPNLTPYENGYILPIKSSLLTGSNVLMQLVIDETSLTQYSLTTDTEINPNKTYYEKVGNDYIVVENPVVGDISQYYEANTPVFKTDIFQLKVKDSINAQETIPEQYPTWINTLNTLIGTINQKLGLVDTALTEMNNLNINVSDKVDGEVTITFTDKQGNQKEVKINDGRGIVSILKTSTSGNIDTYTITYTDGHTTTFQVTNGIDGTDGVGITSIYLTGTSGLTDTYTILYTNGETTTFQVKNGKGITKIEKISTNLLVDTYKITFNDGTTQNYEVTNGKGIVSIQKTSTEGLTDIYTITYNDGTTSTYEVTNGEVSQAQLDALQDELNYYKTIVNALPKITGSGTSITLNNTADSILSNVLNPSELTQETTIGKNLLSNSLEYMKANNTAGTWNNNVYTLNGITWTPVYENGLLKYINVNGTATAQSDFVVGEAPLIKGTSYTGTGCPSGGSTTTYRIFYTYIGADYGTGVMLTATTTISSLATARVYSGATANNLKFYPMIKLSSITDATYEPYTGGIPAPNPQFPSQVHTISGDNTLKVIGSNFFDETQLTQATGWTYSNGYYNGTFANFNTKWGTDGFSIDIDSSKQHTLSLNYYVSGGTALIRFIYTDGTYSGYTLGSTTPSNIKLTSTAGKTISKIIGTYASGGSNILYIKDIMLNIGTDSLPYESYQEQTAQLNLGNLEYCKMGMGNYADIFFKNGISSPLYNATLELDKWYLKKYIGKLVLDGTENWATNSIYNCYQLNMGYAINQHSVNSLSNLFVEKGAGLLGTQYGMYTKYTYNLLVGFPDSTLSDFKTFLGQNNMILYYVLNDNQIIYTPLNETLQSQLEYINNQMLAYKGQTNIIQINNDLPIIIDSTALKDLTSL